MTATGKSFAAEELLDWKANIEIGAFNVNRIKHTHATAARCSRGSVLHFDVELEWVDESGETYTQHDYHEEEIEAFHNWTAHVPCAPALRDQLVECVEGVKCKDKREIAGRLFTRRCPTDYRDRIVEELAGWRRFELKGPTLASVGPLF